MIGDDEPGEQGDVLWQNPVRFNHEVVPRVARIVRHRVYVSAGYDGRSSGGREDEIHVETFSRDARGRSRWCDATEFESVAILKAALAAAHMVLDAHREDEKRRRDAMIEALPSRRIVTASNPHVRVDWPDPEPDPADAPSPLGRCPKEIDGHAFGCSRGAGHLGDCDPEIPF